jgi:hypothetical protein
MSLARRQVRVDVAGQSDPKASVQEDPAMPSSSKIVPLRSAFLAMAIAIALGATGTALAGPGHGGGFHAASGAHGVVGFHGGSAYHGLAGFGGVARSAFGAGRNSGYYGGVTGGYRGRYPGYAGGYGGAYYHGYPRSGYGYAGGGYGYRGGYGYPRGGYGYGGWWGGLGLGLFLAALPLYYETLWWDGIPYYYANHAYYVWDGDVQQYQAVVPPTGLAPNAAAAPGGAGNGSDLYAYPQDGQSADQQASDRSECQRWAASQVGDEAAAQGGGFRRAESACLQAHHYSVD